MSIIPPLVIQITVDHNTINKLLLCGLITWGFYILISNWIGKIALANKITEKINKLRSMGVPLGRFKLIDRDEIKIVYLIILDYASRVKPVAVEFLLYKYKNVECSKKDISTMFDRGFYNCRDIVCKYLANHDLHEVYMTAFSALADFNTLVSRWENKQNLEQKAYGIPVGPVETQESKLETKIQEPDVETETQVFKTENTPEIKIQEPTTETSTQEINTQEPSVEDQKADLKDEPVDLAREVESNPPTSDVDSVDVDLKKLLNQMAGIQTEEHTMKTNVDKSLDELDKGINKLHIETEKTEDPGIIKTEKLLKEAEDFLDDTDNTDNTDNTDSTDNAPKQKIILEDGKQKVVNLSDEEVDEMEVEYITFVNSEKINIFKGLKDLHSYTSKNSWGLGKNIIHFLGIIFNKIEVIDTYEAYLIDSAEN